MDAPTQSASPRAVPRSFNLRATISCWGEPIARKQNRNGLEVSIARRHASTASGWIDVMERLEPVGRAQALCLRGGSTHQNRDVLRLEDRPQNPRRQVASWANAQRLALHEPDRLGDKTAIQEHVGSLRIERAKFRILGVADQMVGIRRNEVTIAVAAELCDQAHGIFRVVVVDMQNVRHLVLIQRSLPRIP
jgi:hypothetical protein